MFGRDWQPAEVTILKQRLEEVPKATGDGVVVKRKYEYLVEVRPDDGATPSFSASVEEPFNETTAKGPYEGQTVRAKFRTKDKKVKFERRGGSVQVVGSAS